MRSSSFRATATRRDPAYANIVLHVVFEDDTGVDTPLYGGRTAPVVALAPWVARRSGELRRWLERPLLWREPCHDAVERIGVGAVGAALDTEGDRRFARARRALRATRIAAVGLDQALYEGLLEALGYGGNSRRHARAGRGCAMAGAGRRARCLVAGAMRRRRAHGRRRMERRSAPIADDGASTADRRPAGAARMRAGAFEALLLGGAGLLPSQRGHRGAAATRMSSGLERDFAASGLPALAAGDAGSSGACGRPTRPRGASPAPPRCWRRSGAPSALLQLAAAARVNEAIAPLLGRPTDTGGRIYDTCAAACRAACRPSSAVRARSRSCQRRAARGRRFRASRARRHARDLFAPPAAAASYGVTRFLENALALDGASALPINARRAQGLLALHRDWCTQGGCGRCPLSG